MGPMFEVFYPRLVGASKPKTDVTVATTIDCTTIT